MKLRNTLRWFSVSPRVPLRVYTEPLGETGKTTANFGLKLSVQVEQLGPCANVEWFYVQRSEREKPAS